MDATALEKSLKSHKPGSVYVIHGPEGFLRAEALRLIRAAIEAAGTPPESIRIDPEGLDPRALLDDLRTPSLFAPSRLIIVDRAATLIDQAGDLLAAYAEKPSSSATLILLADSLDRRKKAVKAVLSRATAVECPAMNRRSLPAWCIARARLHGKRMDSSAARLLADLAGTNLGHLDGQIDGLAAFCKDRPGITSRDVSELVGGDHARDVWEIVRATTARSPAQALKALDRLRREPRFFPPVVLASLAREMRDLRRAKRALQRGGSPADLQRVLGKPDWLVRRFIQTVQGVPEARLRANCRLLLDADVAAKTGGGPDWWILESVILKLCRRN